MIKPAAILYSIQYHVRVATAIIVSRKSRQEISTRHEMNYKLVPHLIVVVQSRGSEPRTGSNCLAYSLRLSKFYD